MMVLVGDDDEQYPTGPLEEVSPCDGCPCGRLVVLAGLVGTDEIGLFAREKGPQTITGNEA